MRIRTVTIEGKEMTLNQISEMTGLSKRTLAQRLHQGKVGEELLLPKHPTYLTIEKNTMTMKEWIEELGLTPVEAFWLHKRYKKGLTDVDFMWLERKREEKRLEEDEVYAGAN